MKKIEDIFRLGMTEPTVHSYLNLLESGTMSREEALIGMVFTLVEQKREVTDNYIKHMQNCTTPTIRL